MRILVLAVVLAVGIAVGATVPAVSGFVRNTLSAAGVPPLGLRHCQKNEWFQCPPPLLRTALGAFEMLANSSSSDLPCSELSPSIALFRLST